MGLAASQGRLLLLTARKSDLEYQSQQISQRRLLLSSQLETISNDYSKAIGNRVLMFSYDIIQNQTNYTATEVLSYQGLVGTKKADGQYYRVTDALGRVVVPCPPDSMAQTTTDENGNTVTQYVDSNGNILSAGDSFTYKDEATGLTDEYIIVPSILSSSVFQQGLRNGAYFIENYSSTESGGDGQWNSVTWQSMEEIQDVLDTDDDSYAQSVYETKTAMIQAQDKKLELELKQVETQHKAIETEVESVQKIITKNIESSFKMFQA